MDLFLKPDLYNILSALYSHDRVMETMEILRDLERPRQYSAFKNSTAWCEKVMRDAGFSDVQRIAHKADGKTASYDFVMPQAWDLLGRSTLEIVEPEKKMIADTDISTIYVSEYSAPTPEGGITAELVAYTSLDPSAPDCKGKFVYYPYYLPAQHPLYNTLAKAGCAGIVFAPYGTTAHEPDVPSWTNGHGHIGWYHLKEDPVVPVFCVSPKTGIELSTLLSKGKVVLHGDIKAKIYDGEIYTVTGTIPGKSEEEFALLAHLYEPFYADDCQGFAVGVEVALMLKKLIDEGVLPQPEKTLRLIFSMERYGFAAFFANHDKKILAALSIDTITCYGNGLLSVAFSSRNHPFLFPSSVICSFTRLCVHTAPISDGAWLPAICQTIAGPASLPLTFPPTGLLPAPTTASTIITTATHLCLMAFSPRHWQSSLPLSHYIPLRSSAVTESILQKWPLNWKR